MEQGFFNLRAQALVATAQRIDPNNAEGLWLSGVVAKQQGDFYQALTFWSQLQLQMNPGDEDWLVIDNLMKELKNQIQ
jgi:cytochrome c-type biogenesis protein CcmH/NrfG